MQGGSLVPIQKSRYVQRLYGLSGSDDTAYRNQAARGVLCGARPCISVYEATGRCRTPVAAGLRYVNIWVVENMVAICLAIYMRVCGTAGICHDFLAAISARPRRTCATMCWSWGAISGIYDLILKRVCICPFFYQWPVWYLVLLTIVA